MRGAMMLTAVAGGLALGIAGAAAPAAAQQKASEAMLNTLTAEEEAAGWRLLFDGKTTAGWRGYKKRAAGGLAGRGRRAHAQPAQAAATS